MLASPCHVEEYYFKEVPDRFPKEIVVCLPTGAEAPTGSAGIIDVQRLSPDEIEIAFVSKVAQLIKDGADDETLIRWRDCALNCSYRYERIDTHEENISGC